MLSFTSNKKWMVYIVGAIVGFFAGGNILAVIFEDQVNDSEGFMAIFYGAVLGMVLSILMITVVKVLLSRRPVGRK
jgi:glycerol uptake facilitator-like aquaporin